MNQVWTVATSPVVLPLTLLFGLSMVYWLFTIFSGMDVDVEMDADIDLDVDADLDADVDAGGIGAGMAMASFFNVGVIPLSALLSLWILGMWAMAATVGLVFGFTDNAMGYAFYPGYLVVSLFAIKFITAPVAGSIRRQKLLEAEKRSVEAKVGFMLSDNDGQRISQCQVPTEGAPYLVNVRARPGHSLKKGDRVLIIEKSEDGRTYLVENTTDLEI